MTAAGLLYLGTFGVAIFFVISGLVIYKPFVEQRHSGQQPDIRAYVVRRIVRIVPPYWIALAVFLLVLPAEVRPLSIGNFGVFAGFGQIYSAADHNGGLAVAWTLDIEICFYAAAPIVALAVAWLIARGCSSRVEGLVLLSFGLASIAVRLGSDTILIDTLIGFAGWFAIGMALAVAVVQPRGALLQRVTGRPALLWLLAAAGYLLVTSFVTSALIYYAFGLLAALVVLTALNPTRNAATPVGKWLGDRSYGIYLWHYPIVIWLSTKHYNGLRYLAEAVLLTLVAAHLSFVLVERPLMRGAARFASQRRTARFTQPSTAGHEAITQKAALGVTPTA